MQQQSKRATEPLVKAWRTVYTAEPGETWCSEDYSQQENRVLVHFAELVGIEGVKGTADMFRNNPDMDCHSIMAELCGLPRKTAKHVCHGLSYGMGGAKLCEQWLNLPTKVVTSYDGTRKIRVAGEEGQKVIDDFNARLPYIKGMAKLCERLAEKRGWIRTLCGRVCHFPEDGEGNFMETYKALNKLIQGGAASQTKQALVEVEAAGLDPFLQVHDEINFSFDDPERQSAEAKEIMETCVPLSVPSRVDVELGPNWGDAR